MLSRILAKARRRRAKKSGFWGFLKGILAKARRRRAKKIRVLGISKGNFGQNGSESGQNPRSGPNVARNPPLLRIRFSRRGGVFGSKPQ